MERVNIGEIELAVDFFKLSQEDREDLCSGLMDTMLTMIHKYAPANMNRVDILDKLLDSSILTNEEDENFEICELLKTCKQILNESKD